MTSNLYPHIPERSILLILGIIQFVNIMDFMMVMPLGPDFATALHISDSDLGFIGGSYTAASAVSGILCSMFIDIFDRKAAMLTAFTGLVFATALGGFAWDFRSLLLCRVLAGIFGGPTTSLAWSIVADVVEPARRGQAMGKIMGAFSLAAILGVPFGLEMARMGSWKTPFFTTAAIGALVVLLALKVMPSMREHIKLIHERVSFRHMLALFTRPLNAIVYVYVTIAMFASFMLIPNLSAYVQYNMHYPREGIGFLYFAGGIVSFITVIITGKMVDRLNSTITSFISMIVFIVVLHVTFISPSRNMSVPAFFMIFMLAMGMRNISSTTLATKIPPPNERAGFMSIFSCVQGIGMAGGAFYSTWMLAENSDKSLSGMEHIAMISTVLSLFVPVLIWYVESHLKKPE